MYTNVNISIHVQLELRDNIQSINEVCVLTEHLISESSILFWNEIYISV